MSTIIGRALPAVLAGCLILCQPAGAAALETEESGAQTDTNEFEQPADFPIQPDVVMDETELLDWIESNADTGGTVCLGASVSISRSFFMSPSAPVTIETGAFSLIFDGGAILSDYGSLYITGEGVDTPVLVAAWPGGTSPWDYPMNNILLPLTVTATGRDGAGGVAVSILTAAAKPFDMEKGREQGLIRSYGDGAVGISLDAPMEAYCYRVETDGENSVAARAPNGAELYYCRLTANGTGAVSAEGGDVTLDTCSAFPEPDGVKNYSRSLLPESAGQLYMPIRRDNEDDLADIYRFNNVALPLSGGEGYDAAIRGFPAEWDIEALDAIDTGVLGKHSVSGSLWPMYQETILSGAELSITVEVRDPALPSIAYATPREDGERGKYFEMTLLDSYDLTADSFVLWRSDDGGETWSDAANAENIVWHETYDGLFNRLSFYCGTLENPVWLVLELIGAGDSNTVALSEYGASAVEGVGGDRTGADREGREPEPEDDADGEAESEGGTPGGRGRTGARGNGGHKNNAPENYGARPGQTADLSAEVPVPEDTPVLYPPTEILIPVQTVPAYVPEYETNEQDGASETNDRPEDAGGGIVRENEGNGNDGAQPVQIDISATETPASEAETVPEAPIETPPASPIPSDNGPETAAALQTPNVRTEDAALQAETIQSPDTNAPRPIPERTVPEPEFPVSAAIIFCLSAAALCFGALFVLRHG